MGNIKAHAGLFLAMVVFGLMAPFSKDAMNSGVGCSRRKKRNKGPKYKGQMSFMVIVIPIFHTWRQTRPNTMDVLIFHANLTDDKQVNS